MKIRKGDPPKQIQLKRQLGLFDSSIVMVGIVIGLLTLAGGTYICRTRSSDAGILFTATGIPVYFYWKRKQRENSKRFPFSF